MKHWQVEPQKDGFGGQKRGEATMKNNKRHHHSDIARMTPEDVHCNRVEGDSETTSRDAGAGLYEPSGEICQWSAQAAHPSTVCLDEQTYG